MRADCILKFILTSSFLVFDCYLCKYFVDLAFLLLHFTKIESTNGDMSENLKFLAC